MSVMNVVSTKLLTSELNKTIAIAIVEQNSDNNATYKVGANWIVIESPTKLEIDRIKIENRTGKPVPDASWKLLKKKAVGTIQKADEYYIVITNK